MPRHFYDKLDMLGIYIELLSLVYFPKQWCLFNISHSPVTVMRSLQSYLCSAEGHDGAMLKLSRELQR
jgi:hypothetical protein